MITLTEKAAEKVREFAEAEGLKLVIRAKVIGNGCAGFSPDLMFDETISDTDEVFEDKGVKIVVDMLSIHYIDGSVIDYVDGVFEQGFRFVNPNVRAVCGCGNSFSV